MKKNTAVIDVAAELHKIAQAKIDLKLKDVHADEALWAKDQYPVTLAQLRLAANAGALTAIIDIPESDITLPQFLRGGGAVLKALLESDGFTVTLGRRYAGHAQGEFHLHVGW